MRGSLRLVSSQEVFEASGFGTKKLTLSGKKLCQKIGDKSAALCNTITFFALV